MVPKEFSCLTYWQERYKALEPALAFKATSFKAYKAWQNKFRKKFLECLGKMPINDLPLDVNVVEELETEKYLRKKIVYTADQYSKIPAYLFLPKDVDFPVPGVMCPHGHGRGKVDPSGIAQTDLEKEQITKYNYNYAEQFALHGYVTLAPDLRCFGERVDDPDEVYGQVKIVEGDHWCDINFILGMLIGYNMLTLHIFDIGRGLDVLQSLKEVSKDRIGCVGLSQGGTTTLFSTAYHDRIRVAGVSGYFNSWKVFPMGTGQICGSQIVPNLLSYGDHVEVTGLISPRPLFLEFGIQDPIFPIAGSRASYQRLKKLYAIAGASDKLEVEEFEGLHEFKGNKIFEFFKKWL
jgi:dienelactone hydrolase